MRFAQAQCRQFFIASKAQGVPLPASGLARDLLIQQSLDPRTQSIGIVRLTSDDITLDAFSVERPDGFYLLDFSPSGSPQDSGFLRLANSLGHQVLCVSQTEITEEPRFTTARTIWSHRFNTIPAAMRLAILRCLDDQATLTLHDVCSAVPGPSDPVSVVMAMLCTADLELVEVLSELRSNTRIRSRA